MRKDRPGSMLRINRRSLAENIVHACVVRLGWLLAICIPAAVGFAGLPVPVEQSPADASTPGENEIEVRRAEPVNPASIDVRPAIPVHPIEVRRAIAIPPPPREAPPPADAHFASLTAPASPAAITRLPKAEPGKDGTAKDAPRGLRVLILGDSMALCGFGDSLDRRIRKDPRVDAAYTYMACGTIPKSWLKIKFYSDVKTLCGFWSIESQPDGAKPKVLIDMYRIKKHYKPGAHLVPKIDDLLESTKADVLVVQTGNNFFDMFLDKENVNADRHGPMITNQITPFLAELASHPSNLRKMYWVSPPTSGRVTPEIQEFAYEHVRSALDGVAKVIDSRPLVDYPYRHVDADKEHFSGEEMDEWAANVYNIISDDLAGSALPTAETVRETELKALTRLGVTPAPKEEAAPIEVLATLVAKSAPLPTKQLLPYQESLAAFAYDVDSVKEGAYTEKQILVMIPAHIRLKEQPLSRYTIGQTYSLRVRPLAGSPWETVKTKDDTDLIELTPYIRVEDEAKLPSKAR